MNALIHTHRTRFTENFKQQLLKATQKDLAFLPAIYLELLSFKPEQKHTLGKGIYQLEVQGQKVFILLTSKSLIPLCIGRRNLNSSLKKTIAEFSMILDTS